MSGKNNLTGRMFKFVSLQQLNGLKYCTLYGNKLYNSNLTNTLKYICYNNEICCDRGNGCCPIRPTKYYESCLFWILVFGMLACYLLCWYCKKVEKERQAARANAANERNPPRVLPCIRPVNGNSVDNLLETLILNYRNRLMPHQQPAQNVDEIKKRSNSEPPPEYTDALKLPKPQIFLEDSSISSNESMRNHADDEPDNYLSLDMDEEPIPSYEEAIKKI